jgi:hypothetical protein
MYEQLVGLFDNEWVHLRASTLTVQYRTRNYRKETYSKAKDSLI